MSKWSGIIFHLEEQTTVNTTDWPTYMFILFFYCYWHWCWLIASICIFFSNTSEDEGSLGFLLSSLQVRVMKPFRSFKSSCLGTCRQRDCFHSKAHGSLSRHDHLHLWFIFFQMKCVIIVKLPAPVSSEVHAFHCTPFSATKLSGYRQVISLFSPGFSCIIYIHIQGSSQSLFDSCFVFLLCLVYYILYAAGCFVTSWHCSSAAVLSFALWTTGFKDFRDACWKVILF